MRATITASTVSNASCGMSVGVHAPVTLSPPPIHQAPTPMTDFERLTGVGEPGVAEEDAEEFHRLAFVETESTVGKPKGPALLRVQW